MLELENAIRKSFPVKVIKVTPENMEEVAEWCGGQIRYVTQKGTKNKVPFIQVKVQGTATPRQKTAFAGDRVLNMGNGFKVYTPKAFENNFTVDEGVTIVQTSKDEPSEKLELVAVAPIAVPHTKAGTTPKYLQPSVPETIGGVPLAGE